MSSGGIAFCLIGLVILERDGWGCWKSGIPWELGKKGRSQEEARLGKEELPFLFLLPEIFLLSEAFL